MFNVLIPKPILSSDTLVQLFNDVIKWISTLIMSHPVRIFHTVDDLKANKLLLVITCLPIYLRRRHRDIHVSVCYQIAHTCANLWMYAFNPMLSVNSKFEHVFFQSGNILHT